MDSDFRQLSFDDNLYGRYRPSRLFDELRKGNAFMMDVVERVREYGIGSEEGQKSFLSAQTCLFEHLKKVDEELYPMLHNVAGADDWLEGVLEALRTEAADLLRRAGELYEKFTSGRPVIEFLADFVAFINTLCESLEKEDRVLAHWPVTDTY